MTTDILQVRSLPGLPDSDVDYFDPIQDFANHRITELVSLIISDLKKMDPIGVFEETKTPLRSVWDEWCWYQANYDDDCGLLSEGFETTLSSMIEGYVEDLHDTEAVLLSCGVCEDQDDMPSRDDGGLCSFLKEMVSDVAGHRSLEEFELYFSNGDHHDDDREEESFYMHKNIWKISGRDAEVLRDVIIVLRTWLPTFSAASDLRHVVNAIEAIEKIILEGKAPKEIYDISLSRIDPDTGGISVTLIVSRNSIDLQCDEQLPTSYGTLESGAMVNSEGRPLFVQLDCMGSFERDEFEPCWHQAMAIAPETANDTYVTGKVHVCQ